MKRIFSVLLLIFVASCEKEPETITPSLLWEDFEAADMLTTSSVLALEGEFSISEGSQLFGNRAVMKWTYHKPRNGDTLHYISVFTGSDITYCVLQARQKDSVVLLHGYWRTMTTLSTGMIRLKISDKVTGYKIINGGFDPLTDNLRFEGYFGEENEVPENELSMQYLKRTNSSAFEILAHRGGGRNADLLPASENSVELIRMASQFGATGVEIDVRVTSDGIPVLFHDVALSERLIQKNGMTGPVKSYTLNQLSALVRLVNGEKIPTLAEALDAVVYETPLRFIWLDIKDPDALVPARMLQEEFLQKAAALGKGVSIYLGIPDEDSHERLLSLPGFESFPVLSELDIEKAREAHADVWACRWTEGLQPQQTTLMHNENRLVIPWTLDVPEYIKQFVDAGIHDGILSNYPSAVAFEHYAE